MTKYIIENLHDKERVESKKGEYKHFFNENSSSMQQGVILKD